MKFEQIFILWSTCMLMCEFVPDKQIEVELAFKKIGFRMMYLLMYVLSQKIAAIQKQL